MERSDLTQSALRDATLSGRLTRPDNGHEVLADFLRHDRNAFVAWFGPVLARASIDPDRLRGIVDRDIAGIDTLIAKQLDAILHHPDLQRLEGAWRGLDWLVRQFEPRKRLKFKILTGSLHELDRDLTRASEFDQSNVFRLIYESEFGQAGGEPIGLLVLDHEISHRVERRSAADPAPVDHIGLVDALASIAAAAFVPTVLPASPSLLGLDRFEDLALSKDAASILGDEDHARWRVLARREDMRFVCVTLPRILARPRWTMVPDHDGGCRYEEHAPSGRERTWFTAGYAFAANVARAHAAHDWPADIRGVTPDLASGGLVLGLPEEPFAPGVETVLARPSLSLELSDSQERDLVLAGLMPLNTLPFGQAVFASVHSLQTVDPPAPGREPTPAQANRRLSAQISAMLCVSRFAHYIKVMGRELTGTLATAEDVERRLQRWLTGYINANQTGDEASRARFPLLSGRISVNETPGKPGSYGCVVHLQPHFQLDDVSATFRLITSFGPAGNGANGGA